MKRECCEVGALVHTIRHAFRDGLRAVDAPDDLMDQMGEWTANSVGIRYGHGCEL